MSIIKNIEVRKEVLSVLTKLSCGLRWHSNDEGLYVMDRNCAQLLEVYKVKDLHYIVWSVELVKEQSNFVQVLKFWDISPHSEMPNLLKKLDYLFGSYTLDLMHLCKFKQMDGYVLSHLYILFFIVLNSCDASRKSIYFDEGLGSIYYDKFERILMLMFWCSL